jgi:hypothetical protein
LLECLEDIWERDSREGYVELALDPASQRRVTVQLNSRAAAMLGMRKEELLARLATHDCPAFLPPLDFLCALLHRSLRALVPPRPAPAAPAHSDSDVMFLRMARGGSARGEAARGGAARGGAVLVRAEIVTRFDALGRASGRPPPNFGARGQVRH